MASLYIPSFSEMLAVAQSRGADSEAPELWEDLVGYWPLAAGGGITAYDLSGEGNHGTLTNMDPATDRLATEMGRALELGSGADEHIAIPNTCGVSGFPFTFAAWFNCDDVSANSTLLALGDLDGDAYIELYPADDPDRTIRALVHDTAFPFAETSKKWSPHTWHLAVGLFISNTSRRVYLDGGNEGANATAQAFNPNIDNLTLGAIRFNNLISHDMSGMLGPTAVWSRIPSLAEIQHLYFAPWDMVTLRSRPFPAAVAGTITVTPSPLVATWSAVAPRIAARGPFEIAAGHIWHTGEVAGELFQTGQVAGDVFHTGQVAGQIPTP